MVGADAITIVIVVSIATLACAAVAVGPAGELLVAQPSVATIAVFDSAGHYLRSIGRPGRGPGEFSFVGRIGWTRDTLWVVDLDQQGGITDTLAHIPWRHACTTIILAEGDRAANVLNPWILSALWVSEIDGRSIVSVNRAAPGTARDTSFQLVPIGLDGDTLLNRRIPYTPMALTPDHRDRIYAEMIQRLSQTSSATAAAIDGKIRRIAPAAAFLALVTALVTGLDGTSRAHRVGRDRSMGARRRDGRGREEDWNHMMTMWLVALAAAVSPAVVQQPFTMRDSAGVRITDAARPVGETAPRLASAPELVIGGAGAEGPYQLWQVTSALRGNDGRIVVSVGGDRQVRVFGRTGEHLSSYGRAGAGPHEFAEYSAMTLYPMTGGEFAVTDRRNRRVHVLDAAGGFVRAIETGALPPGQVGAVRGRFRDGSWLGVAPVMGGAASTSPLVRIELAYRRVDAAWTRAAELVRLESRPRLTAEVDGRTRRFAVPLTVDDIAVPSGDDVLVNLSDAPEIRRLGPDGRLKAILRWRSERRTVRSIWDRYVSVSLDAAEASYRPILARFLAGRLAGDLPLPDQVPYLSGDAATGLVVDGAGRIWAERYRLPWEHVTEWDVLGPDGRWLGSVALPANTTVLQIGTDYLLGLHRDELDVESVVLYRLS